MQRGYKWLAAEIASLNPETEYEKILSLVAQYQFDDFILNLSYVVSFMNVIIAPHGSDTLMYTKKVTDQQQKRFDDSLDFFWVWYVLGPSHPMVIASVERLNKMHAAVGKKLPGNFSHNDDFLQPLCLMAMFDHRLRQTIGLPGMSEHLQVAFHRWLRDFSKLFSTETASGVIDDFPADFAAMQAFAEAFEAQEFPSTENGHIASEALIQQFCERWFPPALRGVGRAILLTFTPPSVRRIHRLGTPGPVAQWLVKRGLRIAFFLKERVLPDPQENVIQRKTRLAQHSPITLRLAETMKTTSDPRGRFFPPEKTASATH